LQGIRGEPAAGPIRAAVHQCRVLRPGAGPVDIVAVAADEPADRSARDSTIADAVPADRPGRPAAAKSARRDHRQPRRPPMRAAWAWPAWPSWPRLLPVSATAARPATRRSAAGAAPCSYSRTDAHTDHCERPPDATGRPTVMGWLRNNSRVVLASTLVLVLVAGLFVAM